MKVVRRVGTSVLLATIGLIVLLGARPIATETILAAYTLTLAAIALTAMTAALNDARHDTPSRFEAELTRERIPPSRPSELVRVERELVLGSSDRGHFERRLLPLLQEISDIRGGGPIEATSPSLRELRTIVDELERL